MVITVVLGHVCLAQDMSLLPRDMTQLKLQGLDFMACCIEDSFV